LTRFDRALNRGGSEIAEIVFAPGENSFVKFFRPTKLTSSEKLLQSVNCVEMPPRLGTMKTAVENDRRYGKVER